MNSGTYEQRIRQKLSALRPVELEIIDDSARHKGHAGHDPRGETHFRVTIVSAAFENVPRISRHRMVYDALSAELKERIHALNIVAKTPAEAQL
jgi:BolA protein